MRGEKGFALVMTLIIVALLVALCAQFVNEVFVDTSARQSFTDGQQASLLAASGVDAAIKAVQLRPKKDYTSQADLEQLNQILQIEDETGTVRVTLEDESGRLNLNGCWGDNGAELNPYRIAYRLMEELGLSTDLLQSLADWRDTGEDPNPAGGESSYYGTLKPPYAPRNGELKTMEELRLVRGIDGAAYRRLTPLVNVLGSFNTKINLNTAPKEVIAAMGADIGANLAREVVEYRRDHPIKGNEDLRTIPGGFDGKIDPEVRSNVGFDATTFRIHSVATVGETTRVVEAVWDKVNDKILYWREY